MHPHPLAQAWDIYLFGFPLVALLFFGYFRLDETFTPRKRAPAPVKAPVPVIKCDGKMICTDPDGRT